MFMFVSGIVVFLEYFPTLCSILRIYLEGYSDCPYTRGRFYFAVVYCCNREAEGAVSFSIAENQKSGANDHEAKIDTSLFLTYCIELMSHCGLDSAFDWFIMDCNTFPLMQNVIVAILIATF